MTPFVLFALAAARRLTERLAHEAVGNPHAVPQAMTDIANKLGCVFANAGAIVVRDLYAGFRTHAGEAVLLVEIAGPNAPAADEVHVVKLGPPEKLRQERDGWQLCGPTGRGHDIVLMTLNDCCDADGRLIALRYQDAQQFIGVDRTLALEEAVLDAVRVSVPTPGSVADVFFRLYERLGLLLYRYSYVLNPAADLTRYEHYLIENLTRWAEADDREAFDVRADATTFTDTPALANQFVDPADAVREMIAVIAGGAPAAAL